VFIFKKEQKTFDIGGVKIGGQPGEFPTVLIGSIFYAGHKIVKNEEKGIFDKNAAEELIKRMEELSERTGNPGFLDIEILHPQAVENYIDFISSVTDVPFLIEVPSAEVGIEAARYVSEVGLAEQAIYNTISPDTKEEEIPVIKESGIKAAIILAFNQADLSPKGRTSILRGGLLDVAERAGIEKPLIDTTVLDTLSLGPASKSICIVKEEFGFPTGCGPINAIETWKIGKKELDSSAFKACGACADFMTVIFGADFVLYGPIENAEYAFPTCALADAMTAYTLRREGIKPKTRDHPLYKIF